MEQSFCEELMEQAAIVDVEFTQADAIVFEKTVQQKTSLITASGGLFSLYAGFSFLSLGELIFWTLHVSFWSFSSDRKGKSNHM